MERRVLLQSLVAAVAVESSKTIWGAEKKEYEQKDKQEKTNTVDKREGLLVHAGENRNRAGSSNDFWLVSGKDTGGALGITGPGSPPDQPRPATANVGAAHRPGIPLHIHYEQDEFWYVLQGELLVQVGDKRLYAKPGDLVMGPRGVPHAPHGLTPGGTVLLTMWQPAGTMEEFFHELAEARRKLGGNFPAPDAFAALFKAHGMEIVGPPVEP